MDIVASLEKKAQNLIIVSGIIATLLMTFGKFIFDSDISIENVSEISIILFVISILLLLITIGFCWWANRLYSQKNPFLGKKLLKDDKLDPKIYESWVKSKNEDFYEVLSEEYALCLKQAEIVMDKKVFRLLIANITFPLSLILIAVTVLSSRWDLFY